MDYVISHLLSEYRLANLDKVISSLRTLSKLHVTTSKRLFQSIKALQAHHDGKTYQ